jgi:hypothetical protein
VWNGSQIPEAEKLHNVFKDRIFCTGAPKFDPWFGFQPTLDRRSFCEQIGIDPNQPYLLYLCSSEFISGDETVYIRELTERILTDSRLKDLTLVVRPHPQNLGPWKTYQRANSNFVVWPLNQVSLAPSDMIQDYFHSLYYSIGVAGINTSAFIEAAIVDKPCIAITPPQFTHTQMGIPHFRHLLDADFLELVRDMDEFVQMAVRLLQGEDGKKKQRQQFVRDFVRPQGVKTPALQVMSDAIETAAMRQQAGLRLLVREEQPA